jgi:RNA polymerase subunit RPABC4/transcription elongation factor Spt4
MDEDVCKLCGKLIEECYCPEHNDENDPEDDR